MCLLYSPESNYKVSTRKRKRRNKGGGGENARQRVCIVQTITTAPSVQSYQPLCEETIRTPNWTPWLEFASELYWPSDRRLSAKLVQTFADRWCHVISVTDPYGRILGFLDWSRYFFFQVASQLYSWGWVDPVLDPLLLWKSGSAGNQRTSESVVRNSDQ
jgi:hypothetical protein